MGNDTVHCDGTKCTILGSANVILNPFLLLYVRIQKP